MEAGDIGSALSEYDEYRKLLKRSVGLEPTNEFQDWIRGLKSWAGAKRPSAGAGLAEPEPQSIDTPSAPSAESGRIFLPPALTSFVGRSNDIAELSDSLPLYRWITLTGPGGTGKTRLAIETARVNTGNFGGGVIYVPVGDLTEPAMLLERIAQQVQLESSQAPLEQLRRFVMQPVHEGRIACLFVLDGLDQLSSEANQVILRLLSEIPNATVLATARKRRGAPGENEYPVAELAVPDSEMALEQVLANPSVQLFVERAQGASARFSVTRANAGEVVELCRRLEGIPLAIELAAAQIGKDSPATMLQRIGDLGTLKDSKGWREPRHRSLQASLAFSLESLDPKRQELFRTLCVFRGGFGLAAAQMVAEATSPDLDVLVEHSLLIRTAGAEGNRYSMLNMVREFGWSRCTPSRRTQVQERHTGYFRQLVADAETLHLSSGIQPYTKLRAEVENIRAAIESSIALKSSEEATQLASGLIYMSVHAGFPPEGREFVRRIRETLKLSERQLARLNLAEGNQACFQEDPVRGRELIRLALPVIEAGGFERQAAGARWVLGYAAYLSGEYEECVAAAEQMGSGLGAYTGRWQAYQRNLLGIAYCELGELDLAEEKLKLAQKSWQDLGDSIPVDFCRLSLARVAWKQGKLEHAWTEYQEVAARFGKWRDSRGTAYAAEGLGRVAADLGRFEVAARLLGGAQRICESIGLGRDYANTQATKHAEALCLRGLGSKYESEWQVGYRISPEQLPEWISTLVLGELNGAGE